jgi:GGDEF domain-containing protein
VTLWNCTPENETNRVADLQGAVGAYPFEPRPGVRVSLSISAGAARYPEDGSTMEELLATGDERMYRDKATRRTRNVGRHAIVHAGRA